MKNMFFIFIFNMIYFLPIVLNIAMLTLLERKVLSSMQRSRGPNLSGFFGLLQPIFDALKLLNKEMMMPGASNNFLFLLSGLLAFTLSLLIWAIFPQLGFFLNFSLMNIDLSLFYIYLMSSLSMYTFMFSGWSSNSKYALLGSLSSVSQMMSYEMSMGTSFMMIMLYSGKMNLLEMMNMQFKNGYLVFPLFPIFLIFYMAILAETSSIPFDLPESESELVAGYNVEYSGITFAFFFLGEYLNIVFMNILIIIFFFGGWSFFYLNGFICFFFFFLKFFLCILLVIFLSGTLPRYSYDQLLVIGWENLLPLIFTLVIIYSNLMNLYIFV